MRRLESLKHRIVTNAFKKVLLLSERYVIWSFVLFLNASTTSGNNKLCSINYAIKFEPSYSDRDQLRIIRFQQESVVKEVNLSMLELLLKLTPFFLLHLKCL